MSASYKSQFRARKGRFWTPEQWEDIARCARVAKGERSGMTVRGAMRALREYAEEACGLNTAPPRAF